MISASSLSRWIGRLKYTLAALLLIVVGLFPLHLGPVLANWAPPDLLLGLTLAWVARQPKQVPVVLIAAVFLVADFLFQRPPGLWAALVVVLTETMRLRTVGHGNRPFLLEWGGVAAGIVVITLINRAGLALAPSLQAPLGVTLVHMLITILFYPAVVLLAHLLLWVRYPSASHAKPIGSRL